MTLVLITIASIVWKENEEKCYHFLAIHDAKLSKLQVYLQKCK